MRITIAGLLLTLALLGLCACGGGNRLAPTPAPGAEPLGFPIDPALHLGLVGADRTITWGAGPEALAYSRDDQPSDDPARAGRSGWNCRVHVAYEGKGNPAVDWYIPIGTPIRATMDGTATLSVITVANAFDYYGVDRAPYVGDPDRENAPRVPFPTPSGDLGFGDLGVFVRIENGSFSTEYAHLHLPGTVALLAAGSFLDDYSASFDYDTRFTPMRGQGDATAIARWPVRRGDVVGMSGDAGYSEAPHLHYAIRRAGSKTLLCPTTEAGFSGGGWLFR